MKAFPWKKVRCFTIRGNRRTARVSSVWSMPSVLHGPNGSISLYLGCDDTGTGGEGEVGQVGTQQLDGSM